MEKIDLKKVLSISGQQGLFLYLAQAKNGVIVESLATNHRTQFGASAKITTLEDVSIYTNSGEVTLKQVFLNIKEKLGDADAPSSKVDDKAIKAFFSEVLPDYDQDKFYVSHMKKVLDWYKNLKQFAVIDFVEEESTSESAAESGENTEDNSIKTASKKNMTKEKAATGTKAASKVTSAKTSATKSSAPKKTTRSAHIKAN